MVGDLNKFQQFQQAKSMEDAAKNGGGNMDMAGMMMANMMMQNMQNQQQNQQNTQNNQNQPPVQSKEDIMKTLKDLAELKAAGVLTEEEFNEKKKELLAKL